ncbi:MAG: hypothetical protein HKN82_04770 [Akkermansiaceae bacterium]|nr:hypothetical protein [Akkermansiaceae bacterium]
MPLKGSSEGEGDEDPKRSAAGPPKGSRGLGKQGSGPEIRKAPPAALPAEVAGGIHLPDPAPLSPAPADPPPAEAPPEDPPPATEEAGDDAWDDAWDDGDWDEEVDETPEHSEEAPPPRPAPEVVPFATPKPQLRRVKKRKAPKSATTHASNPAVERFARAIRPTGLFLFFFGWWLAVLFGHGFDLHRLYWPALFAGTGAIMLAATSLGRLSDFPWTGFFFFCAGSLYFLVSAWASPVYDLGRLDLPLVCGFGLSVIVGATKPDWRYVAPTLAAVALGHAAAGIYQEFVDPTFAVFRHPRSDTFGVSGLYYHRNYLAGFLEIFIPFWGTMIFGHRGARPLTVGFNTIVLVLAGALLVLTNSRGGLAAAGIGFLVAMFIVGIARWRSGRRKTRGAIIALGGTATVVFVTALVFLVRIVFQQRGKGAQLSEGIADEGRLGLVGIAYERWMSQPLFGNGSRSFSYEAITHWDPSRMGTWVGSPNMVHNDYLQVLADYGAVGLILLLGFTAWVVIFAVRRVMSARTDRRRPGEGWIPAAMVGAIAASAVHGLVDFNLHILPNIMMLGIVVGLMPGMVARKNHEVDIAGKARFKGPALAILAVILGLSWITNGWREILYVPTLLRLEEAVNSTEADDDDLLDAYREAFQKAPNFRIARSYADKELGRATDPDATALAQEIGLSEAVRAYAASAERHPLDGITHLNHAVALRNADRFDEATEAFQRAIDLLWRREQKYGAMLVFSVHLAQKADALFEAKERAEALAYFERAKQYFQESWRLNHRPDSYQDHKQDLDWLDAHIDHIRKKGFLPSPLPNIKPPPSLVDP